LDGGVLEFRLWWAPYVAGGWRWGLPVANRPSLVRRVPLELSVE